MIQGKECPECRGTGWHREPDYGDNGEDCHLCHGSGEVAPDGYTVLPAGKTRRIRVRQLWVGHSHQYPWTVDDLEKDAYESFQEVHIRGLSWTVAKELETGTRVAWVETDAELWVK